MPTNSKIHRIYQGRLLHLWRKNDGDWLPVDGQMSLIWDHHSLFQSAINYYSVALMALATDPTSQEGRLRKRMEDRWNDFEDKGRMRCGLRKSLRPFLGDHPDFESAARHILGPVDCPDAVLQDALRSLTLNISGDSAIQQGGREWLPRYVDPSYAGKFTADKLAKDLGLKVLSERVNRPDSESEWLSVLDSLEFDWFANSSEGSISGDKLKDILKGAINDVATRDIEVASEKERLIRLVDALGDQVSIPCYRGGSVNKEVLKDRFHRYLIASVVEKSEFTFSVLRRSLPEPKPSKKGSAPSSKMIDAQDDPVRLARGARGFVFPAFTALPVWSGVSENKPVWKEFDIAAFKEALKTLNQFVMKQTERDNARDAAQAGYDWIMNGREPTAGCLPPEWTGDEVRRPGTLNGDPRAILLKALLEKDLAVANELTEGESIPYFLRERTLRGANELFERWNARFRASESVSEDQLIAICDKFQAQHVSDVGSVTFFRALARKEYWPIWRELTAEEDVSCRKNSWSDDVVGDYASALEFQQRVLELEEPVRFTPADPDFSRRLYMPSDVGGKFKLSHVSVGEHPVVEFGIAIKKDTGWTPEQIRAGYSAPRLRRDGVLDPTTSVSDRCWLQPLLRPILGDVKTPVDFAKCSALQIMPDRQDRKLRILMNFPVELNVEPIRQMVDPRGRWTSSQFNGTKETRIHLLWPETTQISNSKVKADWWRFDEPWSVLSVDLGQRSAGAFSRIRVEPAPDGAVPLNGWTVGSAGGYQWNATLERTGLLRLPGENTLVWDSKKNSWSREAYGSKGRPAESSETEDAKRILDELPHQSLSTEGIESMSFAEQNQLLLVSMRRSQAWLARTNRWRWMLSDESHRNDCIQEIKDYCRNCPTGFEDDLDLPDRLINRLDFEIARLGELLPRILLQITQRIVPLRHYCWDWISHPLRNECHLLCWKERPYPRKAIKVRGQRGLGFERIVQLEELRMRWQSLNRSLMRKPGEKPPSGRELREHPVPDPCPDLLDKLDQLKRQRVNQTAHMIVAEALGVEPSPPSVDSAFRVSRDIHGEYKKVRDTVAFIVLEDLSMYLTSQGRGSAENSRLMKWCHRAILDKVKMLCEPFGIQVLEIGAAYSSKFCSRTGVPGFRAVEVGISDRSRFPWKQKLTESDAGMSSDDDVELATVRSVFQMLSKVEGRTKASCPRTLILPKNGGPLFVPMKDWPAVDRKVGNIIKKVVPHGIQQADINAAINIGLRAIAAPSIDSVHVRLRLVWDGNNWRTRTAKEGNLIEKVRFGIPPKLLHIRNQAHKANMAAFWDVAGLGFGQDTDWLDGKQVSSGLAIWLTVKNERWKRVMEINRKRIASWIEDDLPETF